MKPCWYVVPLVRSGVRADGLPLVFCCRRSRSVFSKTSWQNIDSMARKWMLPKINKPSSRSTLYGHYSFLAEVDAVSVICERPSLVTGTTAHQERYVVRRSSVVGESPQTKRLLESPVRNQTRGSVRKAGGKSIVHPQDSACVAKMSCVVDKTPLVQQLQKHICSKLLASEARHISELEFR